MFNILPPVVPGHMLYVIYIVKLMICLLLQDQLLFCDDCDRGYHMYCLKPPMTKPPEGAALRVFIIHQRVDTIYVMHCIYEGGYKQRL